MGAGRRKRVIYWKYEYRERDRPHLFIVAGPEMLQQLKLNLQSNWLVTVVDDIARGLTLARIIPPTRILVDCSMVSGSLLIERLKRERDTHNLPVLWLAHDESDVAMGIHGGANETLVTGPIITEKEVEMINASLQLLGGESIANLRLVGID